jgi:hypothetical protein
MISESVFSTTCSVMAAFIASIEGAVQSSPA